MCAFLNLHINCNNIYITQKFATIPQIAQGNKMRYLIKYSLIFLINQASNRLSPFYLLLDPQVLAF
jgi:hypothetical protein